MPYFLMGDAQNPVYQWRWSSGPEGADRATAQGLSSVQSMGSEGLVSDAAWADGEWQLLLRRSLAPEDPDTELEFQVGVPIPIALFAWDGDNSEEGTRGSVSSWYFVQLEEETPPSTYIAPLVAFLLTGGLGVLVTQGAQRRELMAEGGASELFAGGRTVPAMGRNFGFAVGAIWLLFTTLALLSSLSGWSDGSSDLGFWWGVIAALLAIAATVALVGTARHRYQGPQK